MYTTTLFALFSLAASAVSSFATEPGRAESPAVPQALRRRQVINPDEEAGDSCFDFGLTYMVCGRNQGKDYCYDVLTEVCCGTEDHGWSCPAGHSCFQTDMCCDGSMSDSNCAAQLRVPLDDGSSDSGSPTSTGQSGSDSPPSPSSFTVSTGTSSSSNPGSDDPTGNAASARALSSLAAKWAVGMVILVGGSTVFA